MLILKNVTCRYPTPEGKGTFAVLKEINLRLETGTALGLIGGSGAGKSTMARVAGGLEKPASGEVRFAGRALSGMIRRERRQIKRFIQYVWQDPFLYLNPYMTVTRLLAEPLEIFHTGERRDRERDILDFLRQTGLSEDLLERRPHQLSGGQCQRVAIARALAVRPRLLICDEILTGLDGPTQVQVLDLLRALQDCMNLTLLFIRYDLPAVAYLCGKIAVLRDGKILEETETPLFLRQPAHPYSRRLVEASRY